MREIINKSVGRQASIFLLFTAIFFLLNACKKEKLDYTYDDRTITTADKSSNIRLVNIGGRNQVIANGDTLTSFIVRDPNGPLASMYPPTRYFSTDGRLGKTWYIPQDLFNAQNKLDLKLATISFQPALETDLEFSVEDNPSDPKDYYLMSNAFTNGVPELFPISRSVTAPSRSDHFKVRIINLTGKSTNPASNASGVQEILEGPITLAYSDGTPVSSITNNIAKQSASEYIELPYGTYQFKVLSENGRQLPGAISSSVDPYEMRYLDPPTSTLALGMMETTNLTFAPVQHFSPGGIYTIVVTPRDFRYFVNDLDESVTMQQNAFEVIPDNSLSANITYCRIQGVNAFNTQNITFRANKVPLQDQLGFGDHSSYQTLIHGQYKIEALDGSGNVIASTESLLRPAQNYTAWLYPNQSGGAKIVLVSNDLSGTFYKNPAEGYTVGTAEDDATYNRFVFRFPFFRRFLNLSPDSPYITFTQGNGQSISGLGAEGAEINLQPGVPVFTKPYLTSSASVPPFHFLAYRSALDIIPGTWADDIPQLNNSHFVARKELYENIGRTVPVQEPGIYTVALIGRSGNNVPTELKARMIVVKHNK